ncbi:RNA pseudouridine synthase [Clostridium sp. D2Q-11]|uniref:RNA pseudouridylate synthase n=1 Tax=Anaeromonas frigoriresistens TaxID=2683708 RepID=A0A942UY92_9FIRM|nr:RNA pseudouridine synthase [Anaeromonas frigoriresistens]MBS4538531.1 RNA pseudouridine synthase [Anaeromonas frigoriresistens]
MEIKIIHEDSHIIVAEKPPKVPSQEDKSGDVSMLLFLENNLKVKYPKIKKPYIGLVHRLDRPTGGVMVFAKTKEANAYLSEQIREKQLQKSYYAVICGKPDNYKGELRNYLQRLKTVNMSKVVKEKTKKSKEAILEYEVVQSIETEEFGLLTLVKIDLKTGRHHQIRVQFSHVNLPLWGDTKYNKSFVKRSGWTQIALWASRLSFKHPKDKKTYTYISKPKDQYPFNLFQY